MTKQKTAIEVFYQLDIPGWNGLSAVIQRCAQNEWRAWCTQLAVQQGPAGVGHGQENTCICWTTGVVQVPPQDRRKRVPDPLGDLRLRLHAVGISKFTITKYARADWQEVARTGCPPYPAK